MVAVHFAAFQVKPGKEAELTAAFAEFKAAYEKENFPGYGKIWAGPVKHNKERARQYTHGAFFGRDSLS
jgi:heme-degrading monooxygenase HmoA